MTPTDQRRNAHAFGRTGQPIPRTQREAINRSLPAVVRIRMAVRQMLARSRR